jgi:hypothetical protein
MHRHTFKTSNRITVSLMTPVPAIAAIILIAPVVPHLLSTLNSHPNQSMDRAPSPTMGEVRARVRHPHPLRQPLLKRSRRSFRNSARRQSPPNTEIDKNNQHLLYDSHQGMNQSRAIDKTIPLLMVEDYKQRVDQADQEERQGDEDGPHDARFAGGEVEGVPEREEGHEG